MECSTGAKEVVMTDREPLALQCALRSASASGIASVADFQGTFNIKGTPRAQARGLHQPRRRLLHVSLALLRYLTTVFSDEKEGT